MNSWSAAFWTAMIVSQLVAIRLARNDMPQLSIRSSATAGLMWEMGHAYPGLGWNANGTNGQPPGSR